MIMYVTHHLLRLLGDHLDQAQFFLLELEMKHSFEDES